MRQIEDLGLRPVTSKSGITRNTRYGMFECPHCGDAVERQVKNGKTTKCCSKKECRQTQNQISQPNKLKPSKHCKILKELGVVEFVNSKGNTRRESKAIFECPECNEPFTVVRSEGIEAKSCGNCTHKVRAATAQLQEVKDRKSKALTTHGMSGTKFYRVWRGMIARCHVETASGYSNYGGKGVTVCDEWRYSFERFKEDTYEGYLKLTQDIKDGKYLHDDRPSIDRISSKGNYCKDNCQWLTLRENSVKEQKKAVVQIDKVTDEVLYTYDSVTEAMDALRALGYKAYDFQISYCCTGKAKSHMGFKWKYA